MLLSVFILQRYPIEACFADVAQHRGAVEIECRAIERNAEVNRAILRVEAVAAPCRDFPLVIRATDTEPRISNFIGLLRLA